ncbi:HTH-type transcriptional regulator, transcriptional repressor of NAD biosynthesis genes [Chitinophaga dinghuensis]|uniref:HTH-type transcriptional regulator, transcriptional repressor of NAD biosynthesis genes n=1 Tax=Chitinophaga dinghuensis TaxID=1539050 RepID=A0A327VQH3_9BACT|nr:AAA family ATPase [Chitinophaga dinghuensis]RAJ77431.1 HTH-type transcriptional regulator, transcriptional repressor of NAD biosynthesis genes [Chitinophaga dinghuensis]
MKKGFVFGKFLPFHKGHEAMIRFAITQCDHLTVLICCSDQEQLPGKMRKSWLDETFAGITNLDIRIFEYEEALLPNSSVSSETISEIWAKTFSRLLPDHTLLITSEPYGEYVARFMGIQHISFDPSRIRVPVSASAIRQELTNWWDYLPDSVKPDLSFKVVLLGTESTGKTTLTAQLADHFHATYVLEAGRDLIDDSNEFTIDDLYLVANAHATIIDDASRGSSPLLFIDTDIHITISYGRYAFDTALEISPEIFRKNRADLYLYLNNDVPYVQDGTRLSQDERNKLDIFHRKTLQDFNIAYEEITGNWEERFEKAVALTNLAMQKKMEWIARLASPNT